MEKVLNIKGGAYRVLFSAEEIQAKIRELAERLKVDYGNAAKPPILLIVLTGGLYFGVDLSKQLDQIGLRHHVDTVGLKLNHGPLNFLVDYSGFSLDKNWIVGYGLDSEQAYRGLKDIYQKID